MFVSDVTEDLGQFLVMKVYVALLGQNKQNKAKQKKTKKVTDMLQEAVCARSKQSEPSKEDFVYSWILF